MSDAWHAYWEGKTCPMHREATSEHYGHYAEELKLLLPDIASRRVLDIGCGDGALFEPLGFQRAQYTGVDFAASMLDRFAERHPEARLIHANAEDYCDEHEYDLIFCNAVVQYFNIGMFNRWICNAATMLASDGCLVIASIPWRSLRSRYRSGELDGHVPAFGSTSLHAVVGLARDGIGRWYSAVEVVRCGLRHDLASQVYGSVNYPYRFHARLRHLPRTSR
ncbi:class I SAM-dependent methyltransferase [Marinivivus vitaminiproducens]|uniref:class I SAM-dependent methyltransferase n=1 Tax=Marinivivus vitaminiproducens TaxID=3035935 RepID=UPI00279C1147|nr:class I SAM-dependent methyltransferase [Geminicoccaceae bacterium SCSIO 64248]